MGKSTLYVYLALAIYALWADVKESRHVSKALWVPLIWLLLCASKPLMFWLYPRMTLAPDINTDYAVGSPIDRNFLLILIAIGAVILYQRRHALIGFAHRNRALVIYFSVALVSVAWATYPAVAMKRWVRAIGDIVMALLVLTEEDSREAVERLLRRCIIVLVPLSLVFIKYYRYIGVAYSRDGFSEMWVGVTRQKNSLGALCAFGCIFLFWRMVKNWPKKDLVDIVCFLVGLFLLIGTNYTRSVTSLLVLGMGIPLLMGTRLLRFDRKKIKRFLVSSVVVVIILQILLIVFMNVSTSSTFFKISGRDATFTGRVPLWTELIKIGSHKPILGAGYGSFWLGKRTANLWDIFYWQPNSGHNGYIDVFMDLGFVGLLMLILIIISAFRNSFWSLETEGDIGGLKLTFILLILVHNLAESSFAKPTDFLWALFLLSSIAVVTKSQGDRDKTVVPS